jgi:PAS domain S-box-containing protein
VSPPLIAVLRIAHIVGGSRGGLATRAGRELVHQLHDHESGKVSAERAGATSGDEDSPGRFRVDARGIVREWDARMAALLGYRADEIVGRSMGVLVPESYRARHWTGFHAAMANGMPEGHQPALNVPLRHKDGLLRMHPAREVWTRKGGGS